MVESKIDLGQNIGVKEQRWLLESFASRAALFGLIYFCINFIYQIGFLSRLGINFGLFSLSQNFPVLENFLLAAYSFVIWGFLVGTSSSTYDHIFGIFKLVSWRDVETRQIRFFTLFLLFIVYIFLRADYLQSYGLRGTLPGEWNSTLDLYKKILLLLSPGWGFLSWSVTFWALFTLMLIFFLINWFYRKIRTSGLQQLTTNNIYATKIYINAVSPAAALLAGCLLFIVIPSAVGGLMADITIRNFKFKHSQVISSIELLNASSFCGLDVVPKQTTTYWQAKASDDFSMHILGKLGDYAVFVMVYNQSKNDNLSYSVCLIDSSVIKSITFPPDLSY